MHEVNKRVRNRDIEYSQRRSNDVEHKKYMKSMERKCLRCDVIFFSVSKFNRLCKLCNRIAEERRDEREKCFFV